MARRRRSWGWLLPAAAALLVYAALHSPLFRVRQVRVSGLAQLSAGQVQRALGIASGTYIWQVRPAVLERRLELLPLVAHASVTLRWPHDLSVSVTERRPVLLLADTRGQAIEVDARGRVILLLPRSRAPQGLPVVQDARIRTAGLQPGMLLPAAAEDQRAVAVAQGLGAQGRALVQTIRIGTSGAVTLQLRDGLQVGFGDGGEARTKTEELLGLLQTIRRQKIAATYIDLASAATPSVRVAPAKGPLLAAGASAGASAGAPKRSS